ncbi:MAG: hypothetical protein ACRETG_04630 [Steroidobacteraceae bacterium]
MPFVEITTRGIPARMAWADKAPSKIREAMWEATVEGVDIAAELVMQATPIMLINRGGSHRVPGELLGSIDTEVVLSGTGRVMGKVFTGKEWAPFVEHGTEKHGRARHMFGIGYHAAQPLIKALFERKIADAVES